MPAASGSILSSTSVSRETPRWIADFDWQDVGPRFLEPIPDGRYKGFTIAKRLPDLVYEYYRLSGRHERTGRPFKETLDRLGLEEFREWFQLD